MEKYDDMRQLCEIQTADKCQSTEISRVCYKLVGVAVRIGEKLFSGHYICYMKQNWSWYFADDKHIKRCSTIEAINQRAYLVFHELDVSDGPVVEILQKISSFSIPRDTEQQPVRLQSHDTIVQHGQSRCTLQIISWTRKKYQTKPRWKIMLQPTTEQLFQEKT